jgi:hypothetical protein
MRKRAIISHFTRTPDDRGERMPPAVLQRAQMSCRMMPIKQVIFEEPATYTCRPEAIRPVTGSYNNAGM